MFLYYIVCCFLVFAKGNASELKKHLDEIKTQKDIDLIFLVDASSSVGSENFESELRFIRKVLSDLTIDENTTRVAIISFGSRDSVFTHVNSISQTEKLDKCLLLNDVLPNILYSGGGTYTLGALLTAQEILKNSKRKGAKRALFLITDGFSNNGDPIPIAEEIKQNGNITIFTVGIKTGRSHELSTIATSLDTVFLLNGFKEFEDFARKALHKDLQDGDYIPVDWGKCGNLCEPNTADCTCGTTSGQYICKCRRGYYGDGEVCQWCPSGTYHRPEDGICVPCSDPNHISHHGLSPQDCICKAGFRSNDSGGCEPIKCPELSPPDNGYFVGETKCLNVINNACGVRCHVGYSLRGNSIRLCGENASWNGVPPQCVIKTCPRPPIPQFGQITECVNPDLDTKYHESFPNDMPVDTECKFSCEDNFSISGSPKRTCLPIAQWDGLRTTCKPIKCHRLGKILFGSWEPEKCGRERQVAGKTCKLICRKGFTPLEETTTCRASKRGPGKWNNIGLKCVDLEAPSITCPENTIIETEIGSAFGVYKIKYPEVSDNSEMNITVWVEDYEIGYNKFEIGDNVLIFHALDYFGNEATCNTTVTVVDNEPPIIENCDNPPPFLTTNPHVNISWDEPLIYDNSLELVKISRNKDFGPFEKGTTEIIYTAIDAYNNTNNCTINITVITEASCDTPPGETSFCQENPGGISCSMTCQEGYGFALSDTAICYHDSPGIWDIPECSPMENPEIFDVFYSEIDCDKIKNISQIIDDVDEIILPNCTSLNGRIKREIQRIEFRTKQSNSLLPKLDKMGISTSIGQPVEGCRKGAVLRKKGCVLCPKGTFYSNYKCSNCPENTFNSKPGSLKCEQCPENRSTYGKTRTKNKRGCRYTCPLGTNKKGITCERPPRKQPTCEDRKDFCLNGGQCTTFPKRLKCKCPEDYTGTRCKIRSKLCLCQNGGTCQFDNCTCPIGYVGPYCELQTEDLLSETPQPAESAIKPCNIIPNLCENGTCINDDYGGYSCKCSPGFFGKRCNILPCDYTPCPKHLICRNIFQENATKSSFNCECPEGFIDPPNCKPKPEPETEPESESKNDYIINFTRKGTNDYLILERLKENLEEFSFCVWLQTEDQINYGTILSYANSETDNALSLTDYSGLVLYINGQSAVTDIKLNNGKWNHLCLTWSMTQGEYNIYVNAILGNSGVLSKNKRILGGGVLIIGQEQDKIGGGFSPNEAFIGQITLLQIWSKIQSNFEEIRDDCNQTGDVVQWGDFRQGIKGQLKIFESTFCTNCPSPGVIPHGEVTLVKTKALYSCHKGYTLHLKNNPIIGTYTRKCTASNIWENDDPKCIPVPCPYPGYVPHSHVQGSFYNTRFNSRIIYHCYPGYEPQTPQTITCQENGTWSLPRPLCHGGQCTPFPKPLHSNITIISEHDYDENFDNNRLFEIGTQLEVTCLNGILQGVKILSCLDNGTWDHEPPSCLIEEANCKANDMPPIPPNSYTLDEIGVQFDVGATVSFKCRNGYLPHGGNYTRCLAGGKWSILTMVCSPIQCKDPPPSYEHMEYTTEYNISEYFFGNMLKYECIEGYIFYGTNTIRCLSTGKWSKLKGKCARVSCNKPKTKPGETIIGSSYLYKDSVKITCPKGSQNPAYTMKCSSTKEWLQIGNCN